MQDIPIFLRPLLVIVSMLFSITAHEYAHAWAAVLAGDDTPRREGRLTFNPTVQMDLFGTIIWPGLMSLIGGGFVGWGRPVDWRPVRFRKGLNERTTSILVALAGPAMNLLLCAIALLVVKFTNFGVQNAGNLAGTVDAIGLFAVFMVLTNSMLVVVNIAIPVFPLFDGFRILQAVLGENHPAIEWILRYQFFMLILVFLVFGRVIGVLNAGLLAFLQSIVG